MNKQLNYPTVRVSFEDEDTLVQEMCANVVEHKQLEIACTTRWSVARHFVPTYMLVSPRVMYLLNSAKLTPNSYDIVSQKFLGIPVVKDLSPRTDQLAMWVHIF